MPDISFACPSCGQTLEASDEVIGQTVACPTCKTQFVIPAPVANSHQIEPTTELSQQEAPTPAPSAPPTAITAQLASDNLEQAETPTKTESEGVASDAQEQQSGGFGRNLLAAGRAAAAEAKRGGQLASITAQIEKLRRLDLAHAHRAVGKQAYDSQTQPESYKGQYDEIAALDAQIAEKDAGVSAPANASIAEKAKAKARSAKMQAEAHLLKHKRNALLEQIGDQTSNTDAIPNALQTTVQSVKDIQKRIADLVAARMKIAGNVTDAQKVNSSLRSLAALLTPSGARAHYTREDHDSIMHNLPAPVSITHLSIATVALTLASIIGLGIINSASESSPLRYYTEGWFVTVVFGVLANLLAIWGLRFVTGWNAHASVLRPIAAWVIWGLLCEKLGLWALMVPLIGMLLYLRDLNPLVTGYRAIACSAGISIPGPLIVYLLTEREMGVLSVFPLIAALAGSGLLALRSSWTPQSTGDEMPAPPTGASIEQAVHWLKKYSGPTGLWVGLAAVLLVAMVVNTHREFNRHEERIAQEYRSIIAGQAVQRQSYKPQVYVPTSRDSESVGVLDTSIPTGSGQAGGAYDPPSVAVPRRSASDSATRRVVQEDGTETFTVHPGVGGRFSVQDQQGRKTQFEPIVSGKLSATTPDGHKALIEKTVSGHSTTRDTQTGRSIQSQTMPDGSVIHRDSEGNQWKTFTLPNGEIRQEKL